MSDTPQVDPTPRVDPTKRRVWLYVTICMDVPTATDTRLRSEHDWEAAAKKLGEDIKQKLGAEQVEIVEIEVEDEDQST